MLRVAVIAGEPSGDVLAAGLLRALAAQAGPMLAVGIAGPQMQAAGCESWESIERLAVMGVPEIIRRYPELKSLQRRITEKVIAMRPDVFIGVDAPEFNLGVELAVRAAGITTVHYVSPSIWAWRESRLKIIRRGVDLMLTLFPFEERYYHERSLPVCYVGHPLADELAAGPTRATGRSVLGIDPGSKTIAVLPGSRVSELARHGEPFLLAAARCVEHDPLLNVLVPLVDASAVEAMRAVQQRCAPALPVRLLAGQTREALAASDAALITSGTATLEALMLDCPMVVAYRVHWLSYALIRPLMNIDRFALPNLLAADDIVPECIQGEANPATLSTHLLRLIGDADAAARQRLHFAAIRKALPVGASARAAEAILALLKRSRENAYR